MTKAAVPDAKLVVNRPMMRDITVTFTSASGLGATCIVSQRILPTQEYEYLTVFTLKDGENFKMNMDTFQPIYRDLLFDCWVDNKEITFNSVYLVGGPVIQTQASCPTTTTTTLPTCEDQGYINETDCGNYNDWITPDECPTYPTCESQGYIFPCDCGSYGWFASCQSCCPTPEPCNTKNQYCQTNSDCCSGLFCQDSSHKCKTIGCKADGQECSTNNQCCSDNCGCYGYGCTKHCYTPY